MAVARYRHPRPAGPTEGAGATAMHPFVMALIFLNRGHASNRFSPASRPPHHASATI
jgi:hypothetical protein